MNLEGILKAILSHLPKIIGSIILFSLFTVIFLSLQGKYTSKIELLCALVLLLILAFAALLKILTNKFWLIFLLICYSLLMVMWGSYVPFIHLIPFLLILFFALDNKQSIYFVLFPLLLVLLEVFQVLPLHVYTYEIGTANSLIILILLAVLLPIFSMAIETFIHLSTLANHFSLPKSIIPFTQFLIKGIYASMILHFSNNMINNSLWGESTPKKEKQELLELFANTSQNMNESISVAKIVTIVCTYYGISVTDCPKNHYLSLADAQILIISLFDLLHNYAKSNKYSHISVSVMQSNNTVMMTIMGSKKYSTEIFIKTGRYIDYLKLYLTLTRKGTLTMIDTPENFTTQYRIITDVV